jgi:hypothetical protein
MNREERDELRKRILRFTENCMNETDPEVLVKKLSELDALIEEYKKVLESEFETERGPPSGFKSDLKKFYSPNEIDISWAKTMVSILNHEGVLHFPSSRLVYQIDHKKKTLTLLNPEILLEVRSFISHLKTIAVFKEVNYSVEIGKPEGSS